MLDACSGWLTWLPIKRGTGSKDRQDCSWRFGPVWSCAFSFCQSFILVIAISLSSSLYLEFPPSGFSLRWYEVYFESGSWRNATARSMWVGGSKEPRRIASWVMRAN